MFLKALVHSGCAAAGAILHGGAGSESSVYAAGAVEEWDGSRADRWATAWKDG
jgi:hypothetical protein